MAKKDNSANLVIYHNDMSDLPLRGLSARQKDIFMSLCLQCKDQRDETQSISFKELRELTKMENLSNTAFIEVLEPMLDNIQKIAFKWNTENVRSSTILFPTFKIHVDESYVEVGVNKDFLYILNDLENNFTDFLLEDYVDFHSGYSKECFRQLRRYKSTGKWLIDIKMFRQLMDVPATYKSADLDKRVLKPIQEELGEYFKPGKFSIEKHYSTGRGKPVKSLTFHFPKTQTASRENIINDMKEKHICPQCGNPMDLITKDSVKFWGHKNYKTLNCKCTRSEDFFDSPAAMSEAGKSVSVNTLVKRHYESIRNKNKNQRDERIRALRDSNPEIIQVDDEIALLWREISKTAVTGNLEKKDALIEKVNELTSKKEKMLIRAGYPVEYMDVQYSCETCRDTGELRSGEKCPDCYDRIVNMLK